MIPDKFTAKSFFIPRSQYKLRPLVDSFVRGKRVDVALGLLATAALKKATPLHKLIQSAAANAQALGSFKPNELFVQKIHVDQGPMQRYFKTGAQGRANMHRRRFSHLEVVLKPLPGKEE